MLNDSQIIKEHDGRHIVRWTVRAQGEITTADDDTLLAELDALFTRWVQQQGFVLRVPVSVDRCDDFETGERLFRARCRFVYPLITVIAAQAQGMPLTAENVLDVSQPHTISYERWLGDAA